MPVCYDNFFVLNSSTPSRHLQQLQRVQTDLVNLTNTQQEDSRDIQELKDDIRAIKEELHTLVANAQEQNRASSRRKLPPPLSVSFLLSVVPNSCTVCSLQLKVRSLHVNLENQFDASLPYVSMWTMCVSMLIMVEYSFQIQ